MFDGVMFAKIIGVILVAWAPMDKELALGDAVSDPVESHVNCLGSSLFHRVQGETHGHFVVGLDRCGWLGVSHFGEGCSDGTGLSRIVAQGG